MDTPSKNIFDRTSLFKKKELDYVFLAAIAGILFYISAWETGLGITNDSINYLSAAQSVSQGMVKADGTPYTEWPPLFPLILSLAKMLHIPILFFAKILNGFIYIAVCLTAFHLLKRCIHSKPILLAGTCLVLFSAPLLQMHVMLWSEPLFLLLILINISLMHQYVKKPDIKNLLFLSLLGILMYLQRKTGIIFIASTCLLVTLTGRFKVKALVHAFTYTLLCSVVVFGWYKRRHVLSGKILGAESWEPERFFINAEQFSNTFTSYFLPSNITLFIRIAIILLVFAGLLTYVLKNKKIIHAIKNNLYLKITIFYSFLYYSCLLLFLMYIQIDDQLDDRILSPVYLPFIISVLVLLNHIHISMIQEGKKYSAILLLILGLFLLYPVARTVYHINRWNTDGTGGYNSSYWKANKIVTYLLKAPATSATVYTNNIYPLKYFLNFKAGKNIHILTQDQKSEVSGRILVCFEKHWTYPEEECLTEHLKNKTMLIKNQDGTIWQLNQQ